LNSRPLDPQIGPGLLSSVNHCSLASTVDRRCALSSAVVVRSWSVVSLHPHCLVGIRHPPLGECHVQNTSRDRMIGALSLHFACLRSRPRPSYERRRDRNTPTKAVDVLGRYSKFPAPMSGRSPRRRHAVRRARPSGRQRAPTAAAKPAHPRRATRVLHRAPAVLDAGLRRADAVDLVSQGPPRPRSVRCGRLVEPAVLAASELVGDALGGERIEPSRAEQPGRTHAKATLEFHGIMRPWRTTTPCSS
jgi:hypothetical protein